MHVSQQYTHMHDKINYPQFGRGDVYIAVIDSLSSR
jgi:hypothetical protein